MREARELVPHTREMQVATAELGARYMHGQVDLASTAEVLDAIGIQPCQSLNALHQTPAW